ncbi:MAG: hypothetical protein JSS07_10570 [Proteobacteria bacterium]|nr:hypothetical protein [Pseudomonadota bacterium]
MSNALSTEQLYQAQEQLISQLKSKEKQLTEIQTAKYPLIIKWQMLVAVLLPLQIEIVKKLGFNNEQTALIEFNKQLTDVQNQDKKLLDLNQQKWNYIFEKAFDLKTQQEMTLEQAKILIKDISSAMLNDSFLQQVDELARKFDPKTNLMEKRQALIGLILPLQLTIMDKHGFAGEEGYVHVQRALLDYLHDPEIIENATKAQITIFNRAGALG